MRRRTTPVVGGWEISTVVVSGVRCVAERVLPQTGGTGSNAPQFTGTCEQTVSRRPTRPRHDGSYGVAPFWPGTLKSVKNGPAMEATEAGGVRIASEQISVNVTQNPAVVGRWLVEGDGRVVRTPRCTQRTVRRSLFSTAATSPPIDVVSLQTTEPGTACGLSQNSKDRFASRT